MRLVIGIGNPGERYSLNRHNVGFMFLDYFAEKHALKFVPSKSCYYYSRGKYKGEEYALLKPSDYVNTSGAAAAHAVEYFKTELRDFLVIVDDINLQLSEFRVRVSGSDGGHNGMSSIIYHLGSDQFPRIRIGVGNDFEKGRMADYVLSDFGKNELKELNKTFDLCTQLTEEFIGNGLDEMLNLNSRISKIIKNDIESENLKNNGDNKKT